MLLQKCENCKKEFSYVQIMKSLWFFYHPIKCKKCRKIHYFRFRYRIVFSVISVLPIFFLKPLFDFLLDYPNGVTYLGGVLILYLILVILLMPFIARYKIDSSIYENDGESI